MKRGVRKRVWGVREVVVDEVLFGERVVGRKGECAYKRRREWGIGSGGRRYLSKAESANMAEPRNGGSQEYAQSLYERGVCCGGSQ